MKTYVVGGAVRDELLGLPVKDRDHVVVGATPEEMAAQGFQPVGKDFPVFLHPKTHEEYALARTERKSGRGYKGFTVHASPEVTLEEDLKRRDLTINAMARAPDGALIDPFGGKKDLEARALRHVSDAFAEDPVRILRVARFAARFAFSVHPSTMALMRSMVSSGETDHLVPERVWQEFAKGLDEKHPGRMLDVLAESGFLSRNLPEITVDREALRSVGVRNVGVPVRFCVLTWAADENRIETLCSRLKVPNEVRELAETAARNRRRLETVESASPGQLLELLKSADAFRRPQRFAELLDAAKMANAQVDTMRAGRALDAANTVDAGEIAKQSAPGEIAARIDEARRNAILQAL